MYNNIKIMEEFKKNYKIANKHKSKNDYYLAIDYYKKALNYKNNNIKCLQELCKSYESIGDYNNAIEYYKKIADNSTDFKLTVITLNEIGVLYNKILNYKEAIIYFKKVLSYKNDIQDVYSNLGLCYMSLKQYKLAEITFLIYLKLKQDNNINKNLANLYFYMKEYDKSIFFYKQITNESDNEKYINMYNLCFPYLAKKNYEIGFELYENRLKFNNINGQTNERDRLELDIPYWDGNEKCEKLLVIYEQGIGDNILYYRFIIQLSKLYPELQITYFCKNNISHIFKKYENITILDDKLPIYNINAQFNYKIYIMSLPYLLKIKNIEISRENYININEEKDTYWNNKLQLLKDSSKKLNVGFIYKGLLTSFIEKNIPLEDFELLTELNVNLICLHRQNEISEDLKNISFSDKITTFEIDTDKAFDDTISLLKNIDLLISIDTSIVHLAGVLNVKTLLLLGYGSDWRWFSDNKKVWYDSVEIIRMNENKDLKNILPKVSEVVKNMLIEKSRE